MPELSIKTLTNGQTVISAESYEDFAASISGSLLTPDSDGYDEARSTWNAMIDRRPALIVGCRGTKDVVAAVKFARDNKLLVSVRGGGHHIAGNAVCDDGLMIDLSAMDSVEVDTDKKTARVGPGASLGDVDRATQEYGLATPTGINSTTGIAGLTLGGGFGWLSRKYGMTVDNLLSADIVTADGELRRASPEVNEDLFWAIRGGGGNFGVITSFEFQLHEVGPEVLAGLVFYPHDAAPDVLRRYREFVAGAPDELTCWAILRKAPPLPFLPEEAHGTDVLVLATVYAGSIAEGEQLAAPLREFGEPIAAHVVPHQFAEFQAAFDPLLEPGSRNYWKSHDFTELEDGALDTMVEYAEQLPTDQCEIFIAHLGGAVNRVPSHATAYPHRDVEFVLNVHTRWEEPEQDAECIAWARDFFKATAPYATGGVYVNFMPYDEEERVKSAYGENYERLQELKAKYDPDNLFRLNQNVKPV